MSITQPKEGERARDYVSRLLGDQDRPAEDIIREIVREEIKQASKAIHDAAIETVRKSLPHWQHQNKRDGSCC